MRIALIGYGKMGKEVERLALERGWDADVKIDITTPPPTPAAMAAVDAVIHFAGPSKIEEDLQPWAQIGKPIVVGTTGWDDNRPAIETLVKKASIGFVYGSNFSVGVNVFYDIVKNAAHLMDRFDAYDVAIHEVHHNQKADSPSGTALTIAGIVLKELKRKKELLAGNSSGRIRPEQLQVTSERIGAVVGTHTLAFDSAADGIDLTHRAKNRSGFALGALLAAEWVCGKKGIFTIQDVFADILHHSEK